ncbi:MAG TPA: DUF1993 domain-containing protein [Rhodanobacteraceae bacterium]
MSFSMYQASVPTFIRALTNLSAVLDKGQAHAQALKIEPDRLLQQRLIFDMFPLIRQVQIACDAAARGAARLAGAEPQSFPDTEQTLAEAKARIARVIDYIGTFKPEQFDGSDTRQVSLKMGGKDVSFNGRDYLFDFTLPTLFFHCTTTYDILRVAGVQVGKRDFLGMH